MRRIFSSEMGGRASGAPAFGHCRSMTGANRVCGTSATASVRNISRLIAFFVIAWGRGLGYGIAGRLSAQESISRESDLPISTIYLKEANRLTAIELRPDIKARRMHQRA